ncbi:hypothetical protein BC828DRAFT_387583 [Blastocladiella britannica]|nr:hypothetical protein BC828DRAFT_387583 [Blastocladiella britannica]
MNMATSGGGAGIGPGAAAMVTATLGSDPITLQASIRQQHQRMVPGALHAPATMTGKRSVVVVVEDPSKGATSALPLAAADAASLLAPLLTSRTSSLSFGEMRHELTRALRRPVRRDPLSYPLPVSATSSPTKPPLSPIKSSPTKTAASPVGSPQRNGAASPTQQQQQQHRHDAWTATLPALPPPSPHYRTSVRIGSENSSSDRIRRRRRDAAAAFLRVESAGAVPGRSAAATSGGIPASNGPLSSSTIPIDRQQQQQSWIAKPLTRPHAPSTTTAIVAAATAPVAVVAIHCAMGEIGVPVRELTRKIAALQRLAPSPTSSSMPSPPSSAAVALSASIRRSGCAGSMSPPTASTSTMDGQKELPPPSLRSSGGGARRKKSVCFLLPG